MVDLNLLFSLATGLITVTAFIVTTSVLINVTRSDFKEFKQLVENRFTNVDNRFTNVENRLNRLEQDVTEIKAICRERNYRETHA